MLNHYLVHVRFAAQRWFKFRNMGSSPPERSCHVMASDGTRIFVLGGSSDIARDKKSLIYIFDTSMYFHSVISFGQPPSLRTQRTSSTRNPSVTLSILMRRPPNLHGTHSHVPRPRSRFLTSETLRHFILLLKEKLQGWSSNGSRRYFSLRKLSGTSASHG